MKLLATSALVGLLSFAACDKNTEVKEAEKSTETKKNLPDPDNDNNEKVEESKTDYIHILAGHADPTKQAGDPVVVNFPDYEIVAANFNPDDLTGATAQVNVKIAALSSGIEKRDQHLNSADLLDSSKFEAAKVSISDVAKGEDGYTAKLKVDYRGQAEEWTVGFMVLEKMDDKVRIKVQHPFTLSAFDIGNAGGAIAADLKLDAILTFTKA